jgi:DNA-binding CsgD family transcriptional regulator
MYEWFLAGDALSLLFGSAALAVVLILFIKIRSPKLLYFLAANVMTFGIVAILAFDSLCSLLGEDSPARGFLWRSINYLSCLLCFAIPRMYRPGIRPALAKAAEASLSALAGIAILLLAIHDIAGTRPIWVYVVSFSVLSLALLYFAISLFPRSRRGERREPGLRHYDRFMGVLGAIALIHLPAFLIVDFFGWILPWPGPSIPRGLSFLPSFYILMCVGMMVTAAMELMEPSAMLGPVTPDQGVLESFNISRREAEVLPLLLQCLSYKEIGERLFIAPGTVRTHVIHIYQKTGASGRLELARLVARDEAR